MVGLAELTDPNAVLAAIAECDERGEPEFLEHYGFDPARDDFLQPNTGRSTGSYSR